MNEQYELTLESQDIQLIVTEGIVSGSKKVNQHCDYEIERIIETNC